MVVVVVAVLGVGDEVVSAEDVLEAAVAATVNKRPVMRIMLIKCKY
jgi:hypothetical protein